MFGKIGVNDRFYKGLKIPWIFYGQCACLIKFLPIFGRKVPIACSQILLQLRQIPRPDDGGSDARHGQQPRDGDLTVGLSQASRDVINHTQNLVIAFGAISLHPKTVGRFGVCHTRRRRRGLSGAIFSTQKATTEWAVGNHSKTLSAAAWQNLALDGAANEAVLRLKAIKLCPTVQSGQTESFGQLPSAKIRTTEETNFPLAHQRVESR